MAMLGRWWQGLQARRERRALRRRAIPDDLWKRTLVRHPFLRMRDAADAAELRRLTSLFLDRKEFTASGGLRLTDAVAVTIAAQAVLPVLRLGLERYDGFVGIVVQPGPVRAHRARPDPLGVVHEYDEILAGEAMHRGPVMLSWADVRGGRDGGTANVVIHEFAHVLDMEDGVANGAPRLPADIPSREWQQTLASEYAAFCARVDAGVDTALDPYGATAPEEFFAVASEGFFVDPQAMRDEHPALYGLLARFYRQDPATMVLPPR